MLPIVKWYYITLGTFWMLYVSAFIFIIYSHPFQLICSIVYTGIYYAVFYLLIKKKDVDKSFVFQSVRDFFPSILPDKVSVLQQQYY